MKKNRINPLRVTLIGACALVFAACGDNGAFEDAGEEIDDTIEDAGDAIDDQTD